MINSLRATLVALMTLALSPISYAADSAASSTSTTSAVQESAAVNTASESIPLETAAEGVDAKVVETTVPPAATQLPYDLKAAVEIALAAFGGEVLKADQIEDATGVKFNIRVVNEGRVRDVVINAANGEIVKPLEVAPADAVTGADNTEGGTQTVATPENSVAKEASK